MKSIYFFCVLFLLCSCIGRQTSSSPELQELYSRLDTEISRSDIYEKEKEARISRLKKE